ncbi:MAG: protein phosphatase 2C domain-containing protein, partial [Bacteroidota bacterium]|nr:protein phosphatase 2C domain-containing protein [Bacteroidota bacterium]MDX5429941.1 protein phosphatase 2C domain-containing protein [Bacteroidota bacterium]MDX5468714.1 protein phosphatase 2C domain-containing protein [Bacteroidota bacterium]
AHAKVVKHQEENLETAGMGTTLVIAWVIDDMIHTAWSGDSRCYVYDSGQKLFPLTDDHSVVWELVQEGKLTAEEARMHPNSNIIKQSLGDPKNAPQPDVKTRPLYQGSKVLVCSDGLNGMISDEAIEAKLAQRSGVAQVCRELVESANQAGGHDNITCLLLEVHDGPAAPVQKKTTGNPTQAPRKKSGRMYWIPALVILVSIAIIYLMLNKGDDENAMVIHSTETLEVPSSGNFEFNIGSIVSGGIKEITSVVWKNHVFKQDGFVIILENPIAGEDTLFVNYILENGKEEQRSFFFISSGSDDSNADMENAEHESEPNHANPAAQSDERNERPSNQNAEDPIHQVDTQRIQSPTPRPKPDTNRIQNPPPRITPINQNTDTSKN